MKKILVAQDHLNAGGAAKAANRWVNLLKNQGVTIRQITGDEKPLKGSLLTGKPTRGWGRVLECFGDRSLSRKLEVNRKLTSILSKEKSDLLWFHNIAGGGKWGWSEELIAIARQYAPVLWTLHDMWALGEGSESYWQEDAVVEGERGQEVKGEGLKGSRVQRVCGESAKYPVTITAPSQWLADLSKKITGQECDFLPNPIDLKIFSPGDRAAARRRWGLPEDGLVVLAGADSLADPRKGFDLLREAWRSARRHGVTLALFGRHGENRPEEHYLGNLTTDEEMVAAYRAADLYVHPARMENAPCTIQESLACGTPVLAFAVGGIPEMVISGKTGFLALQVGAACLQEALDNALSDGNRLSNMRKECRDWAEKIWNPKKLMQNLEDILAGCFKNTTQVGPT
jgi:glycosyltransferase involved in cell wall biosynthesis